MFSLTSSSNATLKDEQKLASGDCGHVTFVVSVVLSLRHWGKKRSLKLPVLEVISYHFHSGHVEPTGGLRVELIPVCIVAALGTLQGPNLLGNIFQCVCCQLWTF